jgi:hypothetical protein
MVREFAQIVGIVLIVVGIAGLALGEQHLAGLVNIDLGADLLHLITGVLLAWVGFGPRAAGLSRQAVGGTGFLYLVVGALGFVAPTFFGLVPAGFTMADNLAHLALGVLALAAVWLAARRLTAQTVGGLRPGGPPRTERGPLGGTALRQIALGS